MVNIYLKKLGGALVPDTDEDAEKLLRFKQGEVAMVKITKPRNHKFHRKFFALLSIGYDAFNPPNGIKNREQFREDITILAGYYEQYVRLDGTIRTVAKSISFGSMSQEDFDKLYSAVIDVLLQKVLTNYNKSDLDDVVDRILGFC